MDYAYDYTVFIGRFQPFHNGHKRVVDMALQHSKRVIILVGSAQAAQYPSYTTKKKQFRPLRNPFSFHERMGMIAACYPGMTTLSPFDSDHEHAARIVIRPIEDHGYNDDSWVESVQREVDTCTDMRWSDKSPKIALIGCKKDNSCYYLSLFPQWASIEVPADNVINATEIRTELFRWGPGALKSYITPEYNVPQTTFDFLKGFVETEDWKHLSDEFRWNEQHKALWKNSPYPVIFSTADAIVVQSGHILLVRRGAMPGKGLWALPGGYVNVDETLYDAAIRELTEETQLKLSEFSLKAAFQGARTFDNPHRSDRGRVITTAHYFRLQDRTSLPLVRGTDDAREASWVPLSRLEPNQLFEDHGQIIQAMIGI